MADSRGGFYTGGKSLVPLQDGAASLVIDKSGRVTVGQWGSDSRLGPEVAAVRQNLQLIVDGARPVDGLADNATGAWGTRTTSSSSRGAPVSAPTGPET